ncbi:MerR family transcriptional regulator (plasmid) [Streptomycetaceae bacterium NBC_01309]
MLGRIQSADRWEGPGTNTYACPARPTSRRNDIVEHLRTGQLVEVARVSRPTLRYYERIGLLAEPDRTEGGHRLYHPSVVERLRVIKAAQRLGFCLEEIAELLELTHHSPDAAERLRARLRERGACKLHDIEVRMTDLNTLRSALLGALGTPDL